MPDTGPDWVLTEPRMNVAIGAELRTAREAAGLTRPELAARLPFPTTVATLLNWELGKRAVSYAKLVELARTLRRDAPELLRRAVRRIEAIPTLTVQLDLHQLCQDTTPRFNTLQRWGQNKLATNTDGGTVVQVHHTVVREFAVMLDVHLFELVGYLKEKASFVPVTDVVVGDDS